VRLEVDVVKLAQEIQLVMKAEEMAVEETILDVAEMSRTRLVTMAQRELSTSRLEYIASISRVEKIQDGARIRLTSSPARTKKFNLPSAVELGMRPFDMKPYLLRGRSSKYSAAKGRLYADIPLKGRAQATVIRRVSDASDRRSWRHPGIQARGFFERVADQVDQVLAEVLR
jgi:hypothetical protein